MDYLSCLKHVAAVTQNKKNTLFNVPVDKQKDYLEHFPEPKDLFERSFFQYKCQMKLNGYLYSVGINLLSLPLLIISYFRKTKQMAANESSTQAVFLSEGIPFNVVPNSLRESYVSWHIEGEKQSCFTKEDKQFFLELIKRYPLKWHFLLKCLIKIKYYSYEINTFSPNAIVVCNEYSFTSSLLTEYCRRKKVAHIDVMHGEKLYYIRDSFFEFDKCYVWGLFYKKLFIELRAAKEQFQIEVPDSLLIPDSDTKGIKTVDYTYYLGSESGEKLKNILRITARLAEKGKCVSLRPHPRYTNLKELESIPQNIIVEDTEKLSIEESILRTRNAISLYSTVLNQALHSNVTIVIDNITDEKMYRKLNELKYAMLKEPHLLISKVLEEEDIYAKPN